MKVVKRRLMHNTGSEGPRHDPYAFEEFTLLEQEEGREPRRVTIHLGLAEWVKLNGRVEADITGYDLNGTGSVEDKFEELTGLTFRGAVRLYHRANRLEKICPKCGAGIGKARWCDGYPGESFLVCRPSECGYMYTSSFNESAII